MREAQSRHGFSMTQSRMRSRRPTFLGLRRQGRSNHMSERCKVIEGGGRDHEAEHDIEVGGMHRARSGLTTPRSSARLCACPRRGSR